ncbi:hypothetical protein PG994_003395 [Apiospora phragmitis]|uniref:Transposase n=1 Tax=Apiospora phragmitis TaxID=2905665 RepID=A0ABR1VY17_9PEZI
MVAAASSDSAVVVVDLAIVDVGGLLRQGDRAVIRDVVYHRATGNIADLVTTRVIQAPRYQDAAVNEDKQGKDKSANEVYDSDDEGTRPSSTRKRLPWDYFLSLGINTKSARPEAKQQEGRVQGFYGGMNRRQKYAVLCEFGEAPARWEWKGAPHDNSISAHKSDHRPDQLGLWAKGDRFRARSFDHVRFNGGMNVMIGTCPAVLCCAVHNLYRYS